MTRIAMVCKRCGSEDVGCDASVRWNVGKQDWEITGYRDDWCDWCAACDGDTTIIEKELTS